MAGTAPSSRTSGDAILDYGVPGGYAWYFPKRDHANLGIGTYRAARHGWLRADLTRFARELDLTGS